MRSFFLSASGGTVAFTAEYQAVLDRATALGYTHPSASVKIKQNNLVAFLIANGIWAQLDTFYCLASDGSNQFKRLNWKNPLLYELTEVNSLVITENCGTAGNGTNSYYNTGWIANTHGVNYTANGASFGCYVNSNFAAATYVMGANTPGSMLLNPRGSASNLMRINSNTNIAGVSLFSSSVGLYQLQRTSSTTAKVFKNGVVVATDNANTSSGRPTVPLYLGCWNIAGVASDFTPRQISMAFTGGSMAGLEAAFNSGWNTYFNSLARPWSFKGYWQSNMLGTILAGDMPSDLLVDDPDLQWYQGASGYTTQTITPTTNGVERRLLRELKALRGTKQYMQKSAVGGTSMAVDWAPPSGSQYTGSLGAHNNAVQNIGGTFNQGAFGLGYRNKYVILIGGESHTTRDDWAASTQSDLQNWWNAYKTDFSDQHPDLKCIIPSLSNQQTSLNPTRMATVNAGIAAFANANPDVITFIQNEPTQVDLLHYSVAGYDNLARLIAPLMT